MIAGGGTGGHLFPGVAIAEELRAANPAVAIQFIGTTRGIEARVLPQLGWDHRFIEVSGLKTVGVRGAIKGIFRLPKALWQARRVVKEFAPDAVIGVGGYASGPIVLMARLRGIRTAIIEQNSIPGLTNKILGKVVHRIFVGFAVTIPFFRAKKTELVGTPIRVPMLRKLKAAAEAPARDMDNDAVLNATLRPTRVFICGGSLGAVKLNEIAANAMIALAAERPVHVVHQTGKQGLAETQARYEAAHLAAKSAATTVECREFIDDMAAQYAWADVIISRAGASTVAELAIAGKPTIFVPYPFAADNHQEQNAKEIVDGGGALMYRQATLTAEILAQTLTDLVTDAAKRQAMARAMRAFAKPGAGAAVAAWCAH